MTTSDARKRNADRGMTFAEAADLIKARMPRSLATPDQENPMTKHDRHDELKALLSKISEESVSTSNVLADVLDLLRERMPEPEVYHCIACGENYPTKRDHDCPTPDGKPEPAEVTEDQPVGTRIVDRWGDLHHRLDGGWGCLHGCCLVPFDRLPRPLRLATPADLARVGITEERPSPNLAAANIEAIKHEVETLMRGHGECCEPAEVTDPRPDSCCGKCPPIEGGGYDCTCDGNPRCAKADTPEEWHVDPAPADDLPGEPVEPSDLRAGDKVAFAWEGERHTCTLVSVHDGIVLRSDTPDSDGFTTNVVWGRKWASGISDVRLIERAPREGEGRDEALARVIFGDAYGSHEGLRLAQLDVALMAREHVEAEWEPYILQEQTAREKAQDRAEKAAAVLADMTRQRDEWQARHEALREDVERGARHWSTFASSDAYRQRIARAAGEDLTAYLARDDERGAR